jgi:predicted PurR-regulated permease PerM
MEISGKTERKVSPTGAAVDITIRLGVLAVLVVWCFQILRPFISPVIWGIIIAVAVYPAYEKLNAKLGDRRKLTAAVMTLAALLIIILPGIQLAVSSVDTLKTLSTKLEGKELKVPPPPERVGNWPVIGKSVKNLWQMTSDNLESTLMKFESQMIGFAKWLLKTVFGAAVGLVMFAISLVIAGVLMASAKSGGQMTKKLFVRLAGERGAEFAEISVKTVRSVVKGIIGVSLLQSSCRLVGAPVSHLSDHTSRHRAGDHSGDHLRNFEDEHSDGGHAHRLARAVGHIGWPPKGGSYGTRRLGAHVGDFSWCHRRVYFFRFPGPFYRCGYPVRGV